MKPARMLLIVLGTALVVWGAIMLFVDGRSAGGIFLLAGVGALAFALPSEP